MYNKNDFIRQLEELALAVRLRKISDAMVKEGHVLYKNLEVDFEPNWFLIFLLLKEKPIMSITEIAAELGFAHPSIHTMVSKIIKKGYFEEMADPEDKRRRLVKLSQKGLEVLEKLEPVWKCGKQALKKLVEETGHDVMSALDGIEEKLAKKGFYERTMDEVKKH